MRIARVRRGSRVNGQIVAVSDHDRVACLQVPSQFLDERVHRLKALNDELEAAAILHEQRVLVLLWTLRLL